MTLPRERCDTIALVTETTEDRAPAPGRRRRIPGAFSSARALVRIAYRDPEHVSERLTLYAMNNLGAPSLTWAEEVRRDRPDTPLPVVAEELRTESAKLARIDGAMAGTPFFIALVPGYLGFLWQEARMGLRTAALYGRDPRTVHTAAEMLVLRGVHPDVEAAEAELAVLRDAPEKPAARRSLRTWIRSVYAILVFGGFLSAPTGKRARGVRARTMAAAGAVLGFAVWVLTWVAPVTFMIALAWACESHTRQLGQRALMFYDGEVATAQAAIAAAKHRRDRGHDKRQAVRSVALALSIAIPIVFVAYVDHVRNTVGINWLGALGALVALSIVIATTVAASRR